MEKEIHFEDYAVEKYYRVTDEVSQNINKIAVGYDNDGKADEAREIRQVMEQVCDVNNDLEKPDWTMSQLVSNAKTIKTAIDTLSKQEDADINREVPKLQGLYDCWQRLFNVKFNDK